MWSAICQSYAVSATGCVGGSVQPKIAPVRMLDVDMLVQLLCTPVCLANILEIISTRALVLSRW